MAEAKCEIAVARRVEHAEGSLQMIPRACKISLIPIGRSPHAMRDGGFAGAGIAVEEFEGCGRDLAHRLELAAQKVSSPQTVVGG
jgi:hypothetical protein